MPLACNYAIISFYDIIWVTVPHSSQERRFRGLDHLDPNLDSALW